MKEVSSLKYIQLNNEVVIEKNGFFQLEKDTEAVAEFMKEIDKQTVPFDSLHDKLRYLVENNYYYDVYESYTPEQIEEIYAIAYARNFQFQSYMAVSKFYNDYALRTNDGKQFLERYEDRVAIVSLYLSEGNIERAERLVKQIIKQNYQPATPTFLNSGRARRGEMVSCFLLEVDDSLNAINFHLSTAMQLSKIGGGVALNLSKLRGRKDPIKNIEGRAKGVVPVMKLLEDAFSYADQMGQRQGAGAVYLNIFHSDIEEFLDTKKINADEKIRIKTLSLGLIVENKFFELAEENKPYFVFSPYSVWKEYGVHLDDMNIDKMYDELVANPRVKKRKLNARTMLNRIAKTQVESGYPYIMLKSNANRWHPLRNIGSVKMSNLCTEIFQLQETSIINDYGMEDEIKRDINCNLGSLNIVNVMENKDFREAVHVAMEALTAVSDMTNIQNAPSVKKANDELHSVGLGAMNLHGYLAKNGIPYGSPESIDFVRAFFAAMNFWSIEKSMLIAKERGVVFKDFHLSDYASGKYFEMYFNEDFNPKTEKVKKLFEGIDLPTIEDWKWLARQVAKYGMYHAYRLAIAPTQSIGYVQNATQSVMPVVELIETRTQGKMKTYYPMPFLDRRSQFFYQSAYDMDMFDVIDVIAEIQRHIDQGISGILYVNSDIETADLAMYYVYAAKRGLKSLYYTRTRLLSLAECVSCAV